MKLNITATSAAALLLLPVLVLAQTDTNTSVRANVTAQVRADIQASSSVSANVIANAKSRANQEIERRIKALTTLNTRVGDMTRVTDQFKSQIDANVRSQISTLTTLRSTIDADSDASVLRGDIKSIATSYRVYLLVLPQSRIAAAADRAVNIATMESALGAKIKVRVDAAAAAGADVSSLTALLDDLASTTAAAVAYAQAAVSVSANLQPDQGDAATAQNNERALQEAHKDIQAAQQALMQGRKDIAALLQGLKALGVSATSSTSAQTQ